MIISNPIALLLLLFFISIFIYKWFLPTKPTSTKVLPPSPPRLPIIGNLHQLGPDPHRSLTSLSQKYGRIMLLHLGSKPTLVISSADAAREIMKTHDSIISTRPQTNILKRITYNCKGVLSAPYGNDWKQRKNICVQQLLSSNRVRSFSQIREEETALLTEEIRELGVSTVNLSEMIMKWVLGVVCRVEFGRKYTGLQEQCGFNLEENLKEFVILLGTFDVSYFIPWLGWINRVIGVDAKIDKVVGGFDHFLERVVQEHMDRLIAQESISSQKAEDFVDVLLQIHMNNTADLPFDRDSVKSLLLDMFTGATGTSYVFLEWAMSELITNPQTMKRLQDEIRSTAAPAAGPTGFIHIEHDSEQFKYLRAVIKETFRLHPPGPLLVPRELTQDVNISGFELSAGTLVLINAWAIQRDPDIWEQPDKFCPERFLKSQIDFKGQDFELIPFGSGRRGCPGISFSSANIELVLANLVGMFDWALPNGAKSESLDMSEGTGISVGRKHPLHVVATPYN